MCPQSIGREQGRGRASAGRQNWRQGPPPAGGGRWEIRRGDLARAIKQSKTSAPGPGGISHKVWRKLGEFGVDLLWGTMAELHETSVLAILEGACGGGREFNAGRVSRHASLNWPSEKLRTGRTYTTQRAPGHSRSATRTTA